MELPQRLASDRTGGIEKVISVHGRAFLSGTFDRQRDDEKVDPGEEGT
jgi:hypothetical protein